MDLRQIHYENILCELLEVLEGGDVALDFEEMPSAATTIRIIADIAGNALKGLRATRELLDALMSRSQGMVFALRKERAKVKELEARIVELEQQIQEMTA
jgi:hypothetical protein